MVSCPMVQASGFDVVACEVDNSVKVKLKKTSKGPKITKPIFTRALNKAVNALNEAVVYLADGMSIPMTMLSMPMVKLTFFLLQVATIRS